MQTYSERRDFARRTTVRSVLSVLAVGGSLVLLLAARLYWLQAAGKSAAALAMAADMDMRKMGVYWSFPILQSSGLVALLFAYVGALLGLWQAIKQGAGRSATSSIERVHRHIALFVVGLVLVHMLATALDAMGDSWRTVLIPGTWAKQGWSAAVTGYNTGIAAVYLLLLVGPSYYFRGLLGPKRWRFIHYFVLGFYVLSIWHAMILGLDLAHYVWLRPTIWLLQIPICVLLMIRLYRPMRTPVTKAGFLGSLSRVVGVGLFVLSAAIAAGLVYVVVTGRSGFIATV